MTERLATPIHSRQITSELLFECYGVPSVVYGIDGLFAFSQIPGPSAVGAGAPAAAGTRTGNGHTGKGKAQEGIKDGLVINMGCWSTTIIPVSNGKGRMDRAKRSVPQPIPIPSSYQEP
jgi:actin-related protein 5